MADLIDKSALVAEIENRIKETESMQPKFDQFWAGQTSAFKGVLKILDSLEVKEVDNKEYWLVSVRYVLNGGNAGSNCFFSYFPTKQDIQNTIGAEEYTILHMQNLTEEQFNKLTGREHGTED